MMQLSGQDATFLHLESAAVKTHFTVVTIYDQSTVPGGVLRYREIVAYFDRIMSALPIFRRRLQRVPMDLDAPYLVDDPNFHVESHIRHIALPAPHDWRQFCILAAQIQAAPMDLSKPLWDMTVVEGLSNVEGMPKGCFALLTRLHHSVADGATVRGLLMALHQPAGQSYSPDKRYVPELRLGLGAMAARAVANNFRQGTRLEAAALSKLPPLARSLGRAALRKLSRETPKLEHDDAAVPFTRYNGELTYRRVFQCVTFPLKEVQAIRHAVEGATVNDVVMSLIGGGMQAYLEHEQSPANADLFALCTVNLRSDKQSTESTVGNNISLMRACLHTRSEDPLERLRLVAEEMRASKKIQNASSTRELIALSQNIPNIFIAAASRLVLPTAMRLTRNKPIANAIITNVPGPQQPLYFLGAEMVLLTGVAPLSPGTGIVLGVLSYNGRLSIAVTACPEWIPDPQKFADCLRGSFAAMGDAARKRLASA